MRINLMADVHGDIEGVRAAAASCDVLLLLGDLINVIDYENAAGILAEVYGSDAVRRWSSLRAEGRLEESRSVLREVAQGREDELRALFTQKIEEAHEAFCRAIPPNVVLTYGNVDVPEFIHRYLAPGARFVDAEVLEIGGTRFGFVGGGLPKVGIPGEVSFEDYARKLEAIGGVDVLCAHIPPAIEDLTYDVVAKSFEPGSEAILDYVREHAPSHVYHGHVHQPRAARLRRGGTLFVNVGHHYRATGRPVEHPAEER